ncbi:hypothetical protein SeMB42_g04462 [Synchytrium endobioticum]|uniref:Uncharacterized protein n=1 Tax=Synchytrium endobioticum TaxID=286115 RepID=A0A507CX01_9FUNG|nr:hypothetical protein SeLEV6574_g04936 [Synchytrium endobioticum]TPX44043.1 hypothetical protein SeMB42_g04462 [Synchytrium endobioticum]
MLLRMRKLEIASVPYPKSDEFKQGNNNRDEMHSASRWVICLVERNPSILSNFGRELFVQDVTTKTPDGNVNRSTVRWVPHHVMVYASMTTSSLKSVGNSPENFITGNQSIMRTDTISKYASIRCGAAILLLVTFLCHKALTAPVPGSRAERLSSLINEYNDLLTEESDPRFEEWGQEGRKKKTRGSLDKLASPLSKLELNPTDSPAIPDFNLASVETELCEIKHDIKKSREAGWEVIDHSYCFSSQRPDPPSRVDGHGGSGGTLSAYDGYVVVPSDKSGPSRPSLRRD